MFVSANHSSSGGNRQPVHNGITAWVEVILFLHFFRHFHSSNIFDTPVEPNLVYLKEFLVSSNFFSVSVNAELVSYPFTSVIFHQIECGKNRKIQDGVSKRAEVRIDISISCWTESWGIPTRCKWLRFFFRRLNNISEYHRERCENYLFDFTWEDHWLFLFYSFLQYINTTGVRVCLKELYDTKYDPLSISYTVLSGTDKIIHR